MWQKIVELSREVFMEGGDPEIRQKFFTYILIVFSGLGFLGCRRLNPEGSRGYAVYYAVIILFWLWLIHGTNMLG